MFLFQNQSLAWCVVFKFITQALDTGFLNSMHRIAI